MEFPYLVLLVSGGHCQLAVVRDIDDFLLLGQTMDDAPGETFDKVLLKQMLQAIFLCTTYADYLQEKQTNKKNYVCLLLSSCQMRRDAIAFGILRLLSFQGRLYSGAFNDCHCLSQRRAHYAALCCTLLRQFQRVLEVR